MRWLAGGAKVRARSEINATPGFVPVEIEGEGVSVDYVLSWSGGVSLSIPRQFEVDSLRRLLTVLEEMK